MTGKHPGHAFIRDNRQVRKDAEGQYPIPQETVTLPKLLKARGYATGGFGKWGLGGPDTSGEPMKQGFDRWFGYNCQAVAHNFFPTYLWDNDKMKPLSNPSFSAHGKLPADADPKNAASYQQYEGREYSADLIAEEARAFVRQHNGQPFFLYWPTTVPHLALQVPENSLKQYAGLWEDEPYIGNHGYLPHFKPKAAYAAMITRMDRMSSAWTSRRFLFFPVTTVPSTARIRALAERMLFSSIQPADSVTARARSGRAASAFQRLFVGRAAYLREARASASADLKIGFRL
jgi:arylsulfatase